jgi:uncharacterized protein YeaO (DUF488 family)
LRGPRLKRVYERPATADGQRILVERLWPRGLSREKARIDAWPREIAPSSELRKWFDHREERWPEFRARYFAELDEQPDAVAALLQRLRSGPATFVFASREERMNNAVALKEYVERRLARRRA